MTDPAWRAHPDVIWRRSLDALILLPPGDTEPVTVVGSGGAVWAALLDVAVSIEDLAARLAADFGCDPAEVRSDVETLVRRFSELGVVEVIAGTHKGDTHKGDTHTGAGPEAGAHRGVGTEAGSD